MKHLKIAFGLVVVAGLMAVVASPAMAVPRWVHCVKSERGTFANGLCNSSGTGWETKELAGTSEVTSTGELELEDKNATGGAVAVKCEGTDTGWVANLTTGPGEDGETSVVTTSECKLVKAGQCKKPVEVKAINLPWGSRLKEVGKEVRDELVTGAANKEAPGWSVTCETLIGKVTDKCTRSGSTQNVRPNRATGSTEFVFDETSNTPRATCSQGGNEAGRVEGTVISKLVSGNALWVLAPNLGT
jgi:hypothetical protein